MNLNKVILIGRLTNDPEAKTIPSGQTVCSFGLATNRVWTNQETKQKEEKTEFHSIVLWRRLAEIASQYLSKGSLVLIEGRVQTRSWQDQAGNKRYRTEIVGDNIQLGPKAFSQSNSQPDTQVKAQAASFQKPKQETPKKEDIPVVEEKSGDKEIRVEDIPF
jgi:single-strand DNA-binding protein